MNIIYGGSFNPITKAHIQIAKKLINDLAPKSLIFLPVGDDYDKPSLIPAKDRVKMIRLVLEEKMSISTYEVENDYKGTYNTLKNLNNSNQYFVIGSDNLEELESWNNYEELMKEYKLIIISRPKYEIKKCIKAKYSNCIFIEDVNIAISSSEYRKTKNSELLDEKVLKYIKENKLYKE